MPRVPSSRNTPLPLEMFSDTAYDYVVLVAQNIDEIVAVAGGMDAVALYLGASAIPPTENLSGDPLVPGNFYLDTNTGTLEYWDGSVWVSVDSAIVLQAAADANTAMLAAQTAQSNAEQEAIDSANSATASATSAAAALVSENASAASELAASNSESAALASENAAALSVTNAATSATNALASENAAALSATNASTSETNAANSAAAALVSEGNADASEAAAALSASNALTSETNAGTSEANALASASAASVSEGNAATSETNALASENKAEKWAEELTDIPVEVGQFSAKHWAEKSSDSASAASTSEGNAATSETNAAASAASVLQSEINAGNSETAAATSAANALTSEGNASTSETNAAASESLAQKWAEEADNVEVEPGAYSARHWAHLAESTVGLTALGRFVKSEAGMRESVRQNKNKYTASGFVHFGRYDGTSNYIINDGMFTIELETNTIGMGRTLGAGTSKFDFPMTHIAGFICNIINMNTVGTTLNKVKLDDAPDGTVIGESFGDARGTGLHYIDFATYTDPKYGNVAATTAEAQARAFEGVVKNGLFQDTVASLGETPTEDWFIDNGTYTSAGVSGGTLNIVGLAQYESVKQNLTSRLQAYTTAPSTLRITAEITSSNQPVYVYLHYNAGWKENVLISSGGGRVDFEADISDWDGISEFDVRFYADEVGPTDFTASYCTATVLTEEVITRRVDMFGAEYWLEIVSLTNPYVYPGGVIQSQATSMNGVTTERSNRPDSYYAAYDGDTGSAGLGVDFWAASDAEQVAIVSDDTNNLVMLNSGQLIQFRVRQRTIRGTINGAWENVNPAIDSTLLINTNHVIKPQGLKDTVTSVGVSSTDDYIGYKNAINTQHQLGVFEVDATDAEDFGFEGQCFFQVWGVVSRLNQGAFHPSHNINGTRLLNTSDSNTYGDTWYAANTLTPLSLMDCMLTVADGTNTTTVGATANTGYLSSAQTAEYDGKYFDVIYGHGLNGVIDYRKSAWDMGTMEQMQKVFRKVVDNKYRGYEELPFTQIGSQTGSTSNALDIYITKAQGKPKLNSTIWQVTLAGAIIRRRVVNVWSATSDTEWQIRTESTFSRVNGAYVIYEAGIGLPVSAEFATQQVIGEPAEILANVDLANGWLGNWVEGIPNGILTHADFLLPRKYTYQYIPRVDTTNDGATWTHNAIIILNIYKNLYDNAGTIATGTVMAYFSTGVAKITEPIMSTIPIFTGLNGIGSVFASKYGGLNQGVFLVESLLGKLPTDSSSGQDPNTYNAPILRYGYNINTSEPNYNLDWGSFEHTPIDLGAAQYNGAALKSMWYLLVQNHEISLGFAYNELVYDSGGTAGNEWGDTTAGTTYTLPHGTINVYFGVGSYTDGNGNTCARGMQKLILSPGYVNNNASYGLQEDGVDI